MVRGTLAVCRLAGIRAIVCRPPNTFIPPFYAGAPGDKHLPTLSHVPPSAPKSAVVTKFSMSNQLLGGGGGSDNRTALAPSLVPSRRPSYQLNCCGGGGCSCRKKGASLRSRRGRPQGSVVKMYDTRRPSLFQVPLLPHEAPRPVSP